MDFDGLVADVYLRLGVPAGDAIHTEASIRTWVNAALQEIDSEQDWPWNYAHETITATAGVETVAVSATWNRTRSLRIVDDAQLDRVSYDELNDLYPNSMNPGRPQVFTVETGELVLRPIPDSDYVLDHRYVGGQPDLVDGEDTPVMPAQFHPAISALAAHLAMGRSREDGRAAAALAEYQRIEAKMLRHKRAYKGPARIRTGW